MHRILIGFEGLFELVPAMCSVASADDGRERDVNNPCHFDFHCAIQMKYTGRLCQIANGAYTSNPFLSEMATLLNP